ncbi:MAG: uracil-DNA glycosylase [Bacillus subtilis]|nr:uracil-DNA glycosylase [Bacillus subtilis]
MLDNDWGLLLEAEFAKPYFKELTAKVKASYQAGPCYPPIDRVFNAFRETPYASVKVVILGQDPYHNPGEAMGLCFSVPDGVPLPPSLQNIFKELRDDLGIAPSTSGDLTAWARRGVLLLNTVMTVQEHRPLSHRNIGWEVFTDRVIALLNDHPEPLVFVLWGANARAKKTLLSNPRHLVVESPHPSPLSAHYGFFGSRPFSSINRFLESTGRGPVDFDLGRTKEPHVQ